MRATAMQASETQECLVEEAGVEETLQVTCVDKSVQRWKAARHWGWGDEERLPNGPLTSF